MSKTYIVNMMIEVPDDHAQYPETYIMQKIRDELSLNNKDHFFESLHIDVGEVGRGGNG